jgi:LysR family glycine cleavage system transcriptional activator
MYNARMPRPEGPLPLPPLAALRAFEAAARLESVTQAASELCVTQTAVSHQVRVLEDALGVALFIRRPRRLELTAQGRAWANMLADVFARLYAGNRALRSAPLRTRPGISVSVLPSFAARWLVPRLGRFLLAYPEVDVRLSSSVELVDLNAAEVDVGIRYGKGKYAGVKTKKLCDDAWVVVCSPQLRGRSRLKSPADLARFTLLHDDDRGWKSWLVARSLAHIDSERGPIFVDSSMLVEAALQGQGVGLVRLSLAAEELEKGRLVRPFPRLDLMPTGMSYFLVRRFGPQRPEVSAFSAWVEHETSALHALGL